MSWRLPQNPGLDGLSAELTLAEVLTVQNISGLGDPGADRILFWDESNNAYRFLTVGSGLLITDDTISSTAGSTPTAITVANEATDTTCFISFFTAASGDLGPKTNSALAFNSNTGVLTLGGNLAIGTNSITITGSIATTLSRVTKGWFTDIESTNMPTVGGTSLSSTFAPQASPTFTGTVSVPATNFTVGASLPFSDSAGTLTLQNIDALDATTESTIEAAIDTLANLISVQGHTLTLTGAFIRSGAHSLTLTTTNTTDVTLPTTGTLATLAGAETFSSKTLTAPKFADGGFIADANGNEAIIFVTTASAVNELTVTPAATGNSPKISATGGDTNIDLALDAKGTGKIKPLKSVNFGAFTAYFTETDNGNSSTADTIDWTLSNKQKSTFTAPPGPCNLILKLVQDGTGSRTVTWPAAVHWSGGTAPTLTTTASKVDIISFYYDGSTYFGQYGLNFTA
jgi:hypothetical protein